MWTPLPRQSFFNDNFAGKCADTKGNNKIKGFGKTPCTHRTHIIIRVHVRATDLMSKHNGNTAFKSLSRKSSMSKRNANTALNSRSWHRSCSYALPGKRKIETFALGATFLLQKTLTQFVFTARHVLTVDDG